MGYYLYKVDSLAVLQVFDDTSYILILSSILVISLVFMFLVRLHKMRDQFKYSHAILYVIAAFFQETYPEAKLPRGTLKLILMWYLYSMILSYMYMSVLIQKLTIQKYVSPVNTLSDILDQDLDPLYFEHSGEVTEWPESTDPIQR